MACIEGFIDPDIIEARLSEKGYLGGKQKWCWGLRKREDNFKSSWTEISQFPIPDKSGKEVNPYTT